MYFIQTFLALITLQMSKLVALKRAVHAAGVVISLGFGCLLGLLGEEDGLDVGEDAALGDGDAGQQLVQLLVIPGTKV